MSIIVILLFCIVVTMLLSFNGQSFLYILLNPVIVILVIIAIYEIYLEFFKKARNISYTVDAYNDLQNLNRDIDCNYSPSVVSILVNNSLKIQDISADIMNLYAKHIIEINKIQDTGTDLYKITAKDSVDLEDNLHSSEKYLLDTLIKKNHTFKFNKWHSLVNDDFSSCEFCKPAKKFTGLHMIIAFFIISIIAVIICSIYFKGALDIILGLMIGSVSVIPITSFADHYNSKGHMQLLLNEKGKEEFKKWMKFKKFMSEYTLIEDKNVEDVILYEKYIPYSVVLGINNNYEGTIFSVFDENVLDNVLKEIRDNNFIGRILQ